MIIAFANDGRHMCILVNTEAGIQKFRIRVTSYREVSSG